MTKCKVCFKRDDGQFRFAYVPGEQIGSLTVAPIVSKAGALSSYIFAVRDAESGIQIAAFVSRKIARQFATRLVEDYGDALVKACRNSAAECEDPEDAWLLDTIDRRADHPTRWWHGKQQQKFTTARAS